MRSKRITRQITKAFGPALAEETLPGLDGGGEELRQKLWENLPDFFATVDKMYEQLEEKAELASRSLEISSEELGQTNRRLFSLNQTFDAILNSLGQGFLLLGKDGLAQTIYSKACENLLEGSPQGKSLMEILHVPDGKETAFREWYELLFQELMDFEDLAPLGPKFYSHSQGRIVQLEFKPVRDPAGQIEFVLMIATDLTKEVQDTERAKEVQAYANFVTSILQNKGRFLNFVKDFRERIEQCARMTSDPAVAGKCHAELKSLLHGLKGGSGLFGMYQVEKLIHTAESAVVELQSEAKSLEVLNGDVRAMQAMFEKVLGENREILGDVLSGDGPSRNISMKRLGAFSDFLAKHGGEKLQQAFVDEFVAEPAFTVMADFNADLKQTGKLLGKKMSPITFKGENFPLIREAYADLFSDMIHVFRNIVDHGIEMPSVRASLGKPAEGRVEVCLRRVDESFFELEIRDDGAGINEGRLAEKLLLRGIRPASREELLDSIFRADVSTSERITEISGRGIGLYAVRERVQELGGKIWVTSEAGTGTCFHLRLPILSWAKR
jgi:two-component system, chemotaxis family, sensor kinase CheA